MSKEIKSLTSVRGLAALWVVLLHYRHAINYNKDWYIIKLVTNGFIAVDIFFLLSAFVMCLAYSEVFKKRISIYSSYETFIKKRFVRIYPAYFFWIFMFLSFEFMKLDFNYSKILVNLLLIQNLFNNVEISFIFWSLSSEWILYLVFPFLYYILQKNKNNYLRVCIVLVGVIGIYLLPSINNYIIDLNKGMLSLDPKDDISVIVGINSIVRCFFSYIIGINVFLLINDYNTGNYTLGSLKYCAIIGIFIVAYFGKSAETYVLTLICSVLLISVLYIDREKTDSFFASKTAHFLGQISYSIYLCHMFILFFASILINKLFPGQFDILQPYIALGALVLLIPVSYLSYVLFEMKTGDWLKSKLLVKSSEKNNPEKELSNMQESV